MQWLFHEFLDHLRKKQYTWHLLITRTVQKNFLLMDIHLLSNNPKFITRHPSKELNRVITKGNLKFLIWIASGKGYFYKKHQRSLSLLLQCQKIMHNLSLRSHRRQVDSKPSSAIKYTPFEANKNLSVCHHIKLSLA